RDRNVTGVQTCALPISYHDGTQAHAAVGSFARNQNAGKQTADAAKAVKDNIAGLVLGRGADDFLELLFEVCAQVISLSRAETFSQTAHVDRSGTQVHVH